MTATNPEIAFKALALYDHELNCFLIMELWDGPPYGDGAITALWCVRDTNTPAGYKVAERFLVRTTASDMLPDLKYGTRFAAFISIPDNDAMRFSKIPAPVWYYYGALR